MKAGIALGHLEDCADLQTIPLSQLVYLPGRRLSRIIVGSAQAS
jgi:hypothetical protein